MAKLKGPRVVYVCQQCGAQQPRWLGKCPECGEWNSLVEEKPASASPDSSPRGGLFRMREVTPLAYQEIESQDDARQSSGINEFDRVLGGGIVPGSLVLIGGEPGAGKSTLLLEVATQLVQIDPHFAVGGRIADLEYAHNFPKPAPKFQFLSNARIGISASD